LSLVTTTIDLHARCPPGAFEEVHRPHRVGREGLDRILVGELDDRLCCEVEDDLRLDTIESSLEKVEIADVADRRVHLERRAGEVVEIRLRRRQPGVAVHVRREQLHPEAEPGPLEAGVAGDQDSLALPVEVAHRGHPRTVALR
jgi:hypothetical protein